MSMINVKILRKAKQGGALRQPVAGGSYAPAVDLSELESSVARIDGILAGITRYIHPFGGGVALPWTAEESTVDSIRATRGLWSTDFISVRGADDAAGGGGGAGFGRLDDWSLYDPKGSDALSAKLGYGLRTDISSLRTSLSAHTGNASIHITDVERTAWNNKVDKVAGKGLSSNDFTDALLTKLNGIAAGANNYTHPTGGANTTIAAANGKVLSAITVNNLGHVTSVSSKTLAAADIPTLAISKVSGLQTALDAKLATLDFDTFKSNDFVPLKTAHDALQTAHDSLKGAFDSFRTLFDSMFVRESDGNGGYRIKAKYGLYSNSFISVRGADDAAGGGGSAFGLMRSWPSTAPSDTTTDALGANLGWALRTDIGTLRTSLTTLTTRVGTAETAISALQTSAAKHVTLDTEQTITGTKSFGQDVLMAAEKSFIGFAARKKTGGGGWAYSPFSIKGSDGKKFAYIGVLGAADALTYMYLGTGGYGDKTNLRISPDGKATAAAFIKYDGTSAQFLKADGSVDGTAYLAASSYTAADVLTKLKTVDGSGSGLDADLLDGLHAGYFNNRVAVFCNFPARTTLESQGYKTDTTTDTYSYMKALLRWAIVNHPGHTLIGTLTPNSVGFVHIHVYDSGKGSDGNGGTEGGAEATMPRYASGVYYQLGGAQITFGTYKGVWYQVGNFKGNADSATKLADNTAFKAWGQTFFENGKPKTVSGDMTGVGSIAASGSLDITMGTTAGPHVYLNNGTYKFGLLISSAGVNHGWYDSTNARWVLYQASEKTQLRANVHILPDGNNTYDLGSSSLAWKNAYAYRLRSPSTLYLHSASGTSIIFSLGDTEVARFCQPNGYLGIKRTAPAYPLDVAGSVRIGSVVLEDDGSGNLKVNGGLWSTSFVSARGADSSASAGGGSLFGLATDWKDATTANRSDALGANLGRWLYDNLLPKSTIESTYLTQAAAASAYQPRGNYLTAHQDISGKVSKSGDTMTGNLTLPRLNIVGTKQSTAYLTADDTANVYFNVGGRISLVINNTESCVRPGKSYNNVFALGSSSARWSNLYSVLGNFSGQITSSVATGTAPFAVASTTAVANLNADLLDGLHASSFARGGAASYRAEGTAAGRWVRVAECSTYVSYGTIDIINNYYNNAPEGIKLIIHNSYFNTANRINLVQVGHGGTLFTKARIVYPSSANNKYYVEVYYNTTYTTNTLYVRLSNTVNMTLLTAYTEGSVPDGYTTKEFALVDGVSAGTFKGSLSGNATTATSATYLTAKATPTGGSALTWYSGQPAIGTAAGNAVKGTSANINLWSFPDGGTSATTVANIMNLRLGWNATYWVDIFTSPNYDRIWYRRVNAGTAGAWRKLAFLDDKVPNAEHADLADNATKLKTARTLWGRSFDGSANVSGNMSDVGNLMPTTGWTSNFGSKAYPFKSFYIGERFFVYRDNHGSQTTVDSSGKTVVSQVGMMMDSYNVDYEVPGGATAFHTSDYGKTKKATGLAFKTVHNDSQVYPILAVHPLGRVGVCNLWPSYELDVTGTIRATQYVRIGTSAALHVVSSALHCNVGFYSDSFISARGADTSSDIRLKRDLRPLRLSVDDIAEAPAVSFRWRDTGKRSFGSVAQYWEPILPEAVRMHGGYRALSYGSLAMTSAIIIARKVVDHEERIRALEEENRLLRERLLKLTRA